MNTWHGHAAHNTWATRVAHHYLALFILLITVTHVDRSTDSVAATARCTHTDLHFGPPASQVTRVRWPADPLPRNNKLPTYERYVDGSDCQHFTNAFDNFCTNTNWSSINFPTAIMLLPSRCRTRAAFYGTCAAGAGVQAATFVQMVRLCGASIIRHSLSVKDGCVDL